MNKLEKIGWYLIWASTGLIVFSILGVSLSMNDPIAHFFSWIYLITCFSIWPILLIQIIRDNN